MLCLSQGKQPHPACSRGCAMSLPATEATRPRSCHAREGWGPFEGSGSCFWEVLGLNMTCQGLGRS